MPPAGENQNPDIDQGHIQHQQQLAMVLHANNDKNPNVLTRRASISKYGSGDLFGTRGNYEQSLLYRSRLGGIPNTYKKPQNIANTTIFASKRRTSILPSEMGLGGAREETWKDIFRVKAEAGRNDLESKRDCTSAINLWASNFELHSSLLEFGIVEAVDKMVEKNEDDEFKKITVIRIIPIQLKVLFLRIADLIGFSFLFNFLPWPKQPQNSAQLPFQSFFHYGQ